MYSMNLSGQDLRKSRRLQLITAILTISHSAICGMIKTTKPTASIRIVSAPVHIPISHPITDRRNISPASRLKITEENCVRKMPAHCIRVTAAISGIANIFSISRRRTICSPNPLSVNMGVRRLPSSSEVPWTAHI